MDTYANDGTPVGTPDNVSSWYQFAQRPYEQGGLGLAPHQAAGVVGNLVNESGTGIQPWGVTGDNGTAFGAAQWRNERFNGLKQFSQDNGLDYKTTEAQQAWMRHELTSTHSGAYDALKMADTPERAANIFNRHYEISADRSGNRAASARAIFGGQPLPKAGGPGALAYANKDDDEEDTAQPALAQGPGALTPGQFRQLVAPTADDRMSSIGSLMAQAGAALAGITNSNQGAVLSGLAKQIAEGGKSNYKYMMGADGSLYRTDDQGGISAIQTPSVKGRQIQLMKLRGPDGTDRVVPYSLTTGQPIGGASAPEGPPIGGNPELQGMDRYNSMTPDEQKLVDGWRSGTLPNPTLSRNNPRMEKLMEAAKSVYSDLDFNRYAERQAFFKGMASKSPTTAGGQFISAPTVLDHLDNLANNYHSLGNNGGGGYVYPSEIANTVKDWTGGVPRNSLQTEADRNADTAGKEITSFLTRGHGGQAERQEAHEKLYLPREAPATQAAALEAYRKQVSDRFYELHEGAKGSVGENTPEVQKAYDAFKAKDEALQEKIAKLKKGEFIGGPAAPASKGGDGKRPPLASFF